MKTCHLCDKSTAGCTGECEVIPMTEKNFPPIFNPGWICPVCGRGMSPYAVSCPCTGDQFKVT